MTKLLRTLALASLAASTLATAGCANCHDEPTPPPPASDNASATTGATPPGMSPSGHADPNELYNKVHSTRRIHLKVPDVDADADAGEQHD